MTLQKPTRAHTQSLVIKIMLIAGKTTQLVVKEMTNAGLMSLAVV